MANEDPPLPGFSGTGDSLYGSFRRERAQRLGGFKRESVKIGTAEAAFSRAACSVPAACGCNLASR